ncbi:hypothetical protein [Paraburkholderia humisilvae]|uniref:Uncharacterized protein n=1 Tax=Paraburkholderia humisilvae TaxID=627669 RepID=A0A6J5DIH9_9BURK|nr:hypothetical protein [Paraburkholderia humisilvae]CAB3754050.1 hypothetical protein LMG29542_02232 [Paraburkholderia humisilvae]
MQPTSFGVTSSPYLSLSPTLTPAAIDVVQGLTLPANFPVQLQPEQIAKIRQRVGSFDFAQIRQEQIATLGAEPTLALNRILDAYLTRINRAESPQIFKLIPALDEAVAKERLGELADSILNAKPSVIDRLRGMLSKRSRVRVLNRVYEDLSRDAKKKSKTLSDVVEGMEGKLTLELKNLGAELLELESMKNEYRGIFVAFAEETVFLQNVLKKAKAEAPALLAAAGPDLARQQEIQDKLQSLESVAVARETMMTRMPAEQIVIRQVQNAAISTVQEVVTTMGDRFASIRMTLITINGTQMIQNVQRLAESGANLDNNLQEVRAHLMQGVVTNAAQAPGNNRVEQANSLKRVVADTQALQTIVENARVSNQAKFEEARNTLAGVRQDLLALGMKVNPAAPLVPQSY